MRNTYIVALTACLVISVAGSVCAESLWAKAKEKGNTASQYSDKRAMKVGDILTVQIVESASSTQGASTDAKKNSSLETGPGVGPLIKNIPLFKYSGGDTMKASGTTSRTMQFSTTMTVTVTKVEDNGNLQVEGTRMVQTNKEKEEVKLTGTVRPQDVSVDNTILSTSIANASIVHLGNGPIGSRQKEGIVSRIFKILF